MFALKPRGYVYDRGDGHNRVKGDVKKLSEETTNKEGGPGRFVRGTPGLVSVSKGLSIPEVEASPRAMGRVPIFPSGGRYLLGMSGEERPLRNKWSRSINIVRSDNEGEVGR